MAGQFTRLDYDNCAYKQDLRQSTDPMNLIMDVTKFVNCNNLCRVPQKPVGQAKVDVESSLWGLDKVASKCDTSKHPLCGPSGCLLTNDPRLGPHITPYACERGQSGDRAVITTNMRMPTNPGFVPTNPRVCDAQGNGYYVRR